MSEVEAIEARIRNLPQSDFSRLREWFYDTLHILRFLGSLPEMDRQPC